MSEYDEGEEALVPVVVFGLIVLALIIMWKVWR
jgi:hypothetical protein